ncbi:hypothetical protein E6U81_11755 [Streptomyces sp. A0592]|nr:hypothetical protein E6U81_11755 [Streptomyces sp. A0592]
MGTQKPVRRIIDADEAVTALERAVPGLVDIRRQEPAVFGWREVEEILGTALPADFKALAEWCPPFELDDFLTVSLPEPGEERDWARAMEKENGDWGSNCPAELRPEELLSAPLMAWADSAEGDRFFWSGLEGDPDHWPVTVWSRNGPWWHYEGGTVQFLAELCGASVEPWALPTVRPRVTGWGTEDGGWHRTV